MSDTAAIGSLYSYEKRSSAVVGSAARSSANVVSGRAVIRAAGRSSHPRQDPTGTSFVDAARWSRFRVDAAPTGETRPG